MATFFLENFGCRATDADTRAIHRALLAEGFLFHQDSRLADLVVLNTCTVTASADSQAREAVRKIHRANPAARIVVTGCYAQRAPEELALLDGVACVVGNSHQTEIPRVLRELSATFVTPTPAPTHRSSDFISLDELESQPMSLAHGAAKILSGDIFAQAAFLSSPGQNASDDRTRPVLKIQDGCNNRCSYCVIPFVRGRSRSLPPDGVIREVRALIMGGAKEIVLSGINLGTYGRDLTPRVELITLVRSVLNETALEQLRFSSIEPQDVTEDFVALVAWSDRIAPHFHIPLQSGSDRILRAMHRWYRANHYAERVKLIRALLPEAAIGADVIAGFPGETDEDFETTVAFIDRLPFAYLHVFSFSERPGTEAAKLSDFVPPPVIRERARRLRALSQRKLLEFRASQHGRTMRALTLGRRAENWTEALTGNYLKLRVAGRYAANQWIEAPITADAAEILPPPERGPALALEDHLCQREIAAVRDR
jgi:threonylcarbamoyladenosine tRNA methylthiotransferase MtaB